MAYAGTFVDDRGRIIGYDEQGNHTDTGQMAAAPAPAPAPASDPVYAGTFVDDRGRVIGYDAQGNHTDTGQMAAAPAPASAPAPSPATSTGGSVLSLLGGQGEWLKDPNAGANSANEYRTRGEINLNTMQYYFPELNQGKNAREEYNNAMSAVRTKDASGATFGGMQARPAANLGMGSTNTAPGGAAGSAQQPGSGQPMPMPMQTGGYNDFFARQGGAGPGGSQLQGGRQGYPMPQQSRRQGGYRGQYGGANPPSMQGGGFMGGYTGGLRNPDGSPLATTNTMPGGGGVRKMPETGGLEPNPGGYGRGTAPETGGLEPNPGSNFGLPGGGQGSYIPGTNAAGMPTPPGGGGISKLDPRYTNPMSGGIAGPARSGSGELLQTGRMSPKEMQQYGGGEMSQPGDGGFGLPGGGQGSYIPGTNAAGMPTPPGGGGVRKMPETGGLEPNPGSNFGMPRRFGGISGGIFESDGAGGMRVIEPGPGGYGRGTAPETGGLEPNPGGYGGGRGTFLETGRLKPAPTMPDGIRYDFPNSKGEYGPETGPLKPGQWIAQDELGSTGQRGMPKYDPSGMPGGGGFGMPGQTIPGTNLNGTQYGSRAMGQDAQGPNPYIDQMASGITNQVKQNFLQQIAPQLRSGAQSSGQYGGSRQGISEGVAAGNAATGLAGQLSSLYGNAYNTDQSNQTQRRGQDQNYDLGLGQLDLGYQNSDNSYNLGLGQLDLANQGQNQNFYASQRGQDLQQYQIGSGMYNSGVNGQIGVGQGQYNVGQQYQNAPWNVLGQYGQIISPYTGYGQTQTQSGQSGGGMNGVIGGGLAGAQIANNMWRRN